MNTRRIGKIFIGFGVILLLAYIGWILFRVIKQPEKVAETGLLPNPFDVVLPRLRESTPSEIIEVGNKPDEAVVVTPLEVASSKRLFRISTEPSLSFELIERTQQTVSTNPVTGEAQSGNQNVVTVRYATRDEGFIVDAEIGETEVVEKRLSSAFLSGIYSLDMSRYGLVGQYSARLGQEPVAYSLVMETPPRNANNVASPAIESGPVCRYVLTKISLGQSSYDVSSVQDILIASGVTLPLTQGVFDDAMKKAVIEYQKLSGITPTSGIIGAKTLAQLQADCNRLLPKQIEQPNPIDEAERDQAKITLLPSGVYSVSMLDDTRAFIMINSRGKNRGVIRDLSTNVDTEVYSLGFVDWVTSLLTPDTLLLTTKASGEVPGYAFQVGTNDRKIFPVLSGIVGLSVLPSPDGQYILYSSTEGGLPSLTLYSLATKVSIPIALQTFAEKCTWATDSGSFYCFVPGSMDELYVYPDEWYKRGIDIRDTLKRYNLETESVESIDTIGEIATIKADSIEQSVTSDQALVVFRDWKSGYIWGYKLK